MLAYWPAGCALFAICGVVAAAEKDTPAAARTRTKLAVKISVDFKDQRIEDCLREIADKLSEADGSNLSSTFDVGVSRNQTITFSAKDQTITEILDALLKKNALGYVVVSKDKDRYDGFLRITKGNERGYPIGNEPKSKAPAKTMETNSKPAADSEKAAAAKLEFARSLLKDGKTERARQRLDEIIQQFPKSHAADEARKELAKLGR